MRFADAVKSKDVRIPLAVLRIILGLMFLWAFFDKLFGLGYATPAGSGMIDGGSPTYFFLEYSDGWFSGIFHEMAGFSDVTDILLMIGLLCLGIGLTAGIATRLVTLFSVLMYILFYLSTVPFDSNPLLDYHLVYIFAVIAIWYAGADRLFSLGDWWNDLEIVKRYKMLQ